MAHATAGCLPTVLSRTVQHDGASALGAERQFARTDNYHPRPKTYMSFFNAPFLFRSVTPASQRVQ